VNRALWALIAASGLLRLAWAASLGPITNEAYYYLYARHLDWGYFDHPPMVALVSRVGMALLGGAPLVLALRSGFIVLFAGSTWLIARLTARPYGPRAGFFAALALNMAGYFGLVVGTTASPDGPLLFFWLLTLDRLAVALERPRRATAWLAAGSAWGGAMLSKYPAVLLPAGFVSYLLVCPRARLCLRTPGPYAALALGSVLFAPVVAWNAAHHWASFTFQGSRAMNSLWPRPELLAEAVGIGALFLFPWIWLPLVAILFRLLGRRPRRWTGPEAFLVSQAVPALVLFLGVASFRHIMPYWPLIGFVSLMPLLGREWSAILDSHPVRGRQLAFFAAVPVVVAGLVVAQARLGLLQDGRGRYLGLVAPRDDPMVELYGWDQVAMELECRGLLDGPQTFVLTDSWRQSAQIAFATREQVPVACYHEDARGFTYWSGPGDRVGWDAVFVEASDHATEPVDATRWFRKVEPLGEFPIRRGGATVRTVRLYRCLHQLGPFPFGNGGSVGESEGMGQRPRPDLARRARPDSERR
jgi:hypothetical protein